MSSWRDGQFGTDFLAVDAGDDDAEMARQVLRAELVEVFRVSS
jgi:hypothetical protein